MPDWTVPGRPPVDSEESGYEVPELQVDDVPNDVLGELLGPDGGVISTLYERPVVLMGFQPRRKTPSRIVRAEGW